MGTKRIAFLGVDSLAGFEQVKWWNLGKAHAAKYQSQDRPADFIDVFGVGRQRELRVPHPYGLGVEELAQGEPIWMHIPPQYYDRVAASTKVKVTAVACSGRAGADVQVVIDSLKAGKAVFVESVEHFSEEALGQVVELASAPGAPLFMIGLYQRFDAQLTRVAEEGIDSRVGRPLLYQAHASTLDGSLFDLGMQHVDAVRWVMGSEVVEVFAAGTSLRLSRCDVLSLTLKLANGCVASLALDRSGTSATERILVVGDQSRAEFEANLLEAPGLSAHAMRLQKAGVNHFIEAVLKGGPARMGLGDVLRACAVMAAAEASLRSGGAVAVAEVGAGAGGALSAVGGGSWAGQVASKVAELAFKASGKAAAAVGLDRESSEQQSDTPPRDHYSKGAHMGTRTPDSPELLAPPATRAGH